VNVINREYSDIHDVVRERVDGNCVTRSLVLCICFVDRCLSFCTCSFGHCIVCSFSIYRFWLPPFGILYIQILITSLWNLRYTDADYLFGIFKLFLSIWLSCLGTLIPPKILNVSTTLSLDLERTWRLFAL
jgi:hypothetical protein